MKYALKVFTLTYLVTAAVTAYAASHECIKEKVVLYNRFSSSHQTTVLKEIEKFLDIKSKSSRSISGILKVHKNDAGRTDLCSETQNVCRRLIESARRTGYSSFRRLAQHACSEDFRIFADDLNSERRKAKASVNDRYYSREKKDIELIKVDKTWPLSHGSSSVEVAIIDTGIDYTHPDLARNIDVSSSADFSTDQDLSDPMDDNGHGTHVAGTIAAVGNNKIGVAGIAWNVKIVALKFLDGSGSGTLDGAVRAIDRMVALKQAGVNIVVANNSWGGGGYSESLAAAIRNANDAGIVFTAAAGNEANNNDADPSYPASYQVSNVVSVAAVDSSDKTLAYFSNYGRSSVIIGAPGVDIASTYAGGGYARLSGTSMATPHVTGAIALLASYDSSLDKDGLINRLLSTAKYDSELTGAVQKSRLLNVYNMLRNITSEAKKPKKH